MTAIESFSWIIKTISLGEKSPEYDKDNICWISVESGKEITVGSHSDAFLESRKSLLGTELYGFLQCIPSRPGVSMNSNLIQSELDLLELTAQTPIPRFDLRLSYISTDCPSRMSELGEYSRDCIWWAAQKRVIQQKLCRESAIGWIEFPNRIESKVISLERCSLRKTFGSIECDAESIGQGNQRR